MYDSEIRYVEDLGLVQSEYRILNILNLYFYNAYVVMSIFTSTLVA